MMRPVALGVAALIGMAAWGYADAAPRHHRSDVAATDRPLTIKRQHAGIYRQGNDIIAPGGFSAHGYGYPVATAQDRRRLNNARIRDTATGEFYAGNYVGGGFDGTDSFPGAFANPYYGNTYNRYVGYNGVPTTFAFGPAFANRYLAEHDPADDDPRPGPSPGDLGFQAFTGDDD